MRSAAKGPTRGRGFVWPPGKATKMGRAEALPRSVVSRRGCQPCSRTQMPAMKIAAQKLIASSSTALAPRLAADDVHAGLPIQRGEDIAGLPEALELGQLGILFRHRALDDAADHGADHRGNLGSNALCGRDSHW